MHQQLKVSSKLVLVLNFKVVLASFLPGHLLEPKSKKQRKMERTPLTLTRLPPENTISREETEVSHVVKEPNIIEPVSVINGQNTLNYSNSSSETKSAFFMKDCNGGLT